jgi:hypothetical protein
MEEATPPPRDDNVGRGLASVGRASNAPSPSARTRAAQAKANAKANDVELGSD